MSLDEKMIRLIAVGASISANCQPCLQINLGKATEKGASQDEIAQAMRVGTLVRAGAASKMDAFIASLKGEVPVAAGSPQPGCECS